MPFNFDIGEQETRLGSIDDIKKQWAALDFSSLESTPIIQVAGTTVQNELCLVLSPESGGIETEERAYRVSQMLAVSLRETIQAFHWVMVVCMAGCQPLIDFSITVLARSFEVLSLSLKENLRRIYFLHPGVSTGLALDQEQQSESFKRRVVYVDSLEKLQDLMFLHEGKRILDYVSAASLKQDGREVHVMGALENAHSRPAWGLPPVPEWLTSLSAALLQRSVFQEKLLFMSPVSQASMAKVLSCLEGGLSAWNLCPLNVPAICRTMLVVLGSIPGGILGPTSFDQILSRLGSNGADCPKVAQRKCLQALLSKRPLITRTTLRYIGMLLKKLVGESKRNGLELTLAADLFGGVLSKPDPDSWTPDTPSKFPIIRALMGLVIEDPNVVQLDENEDEYDGYEYEEDEEEEDEEEEDEEEVQTHMKKVDVAKKSGFQELREAVKEKTGAIKNAIRGTVQGETSKAEGEDDEYEYYDDDDDDDDEEEGEWEYEYV